MINIGIIGAGRIGQVHAKSILTGVPQARILAIADPYLSEQAEKWAQSVGIEGIYRDHHKILDDPRIDAVLICSSTDTHAPISLEAIRAGKHVFCEKSIGFTMEECYRMYQKHRSTGKIFFTGQQRLFDPRYIKAMEMIHAGTFGEINAIRTFWNRNGDWRRSVPSPNLERLINWRLYKEFSKGLMTELACHQLQIGSWALRKIPEKVMGHGAITYWKDGRDVYDNVSCVLMMV